MSRTPRKHCDCTGEIRTDVNCAMDCRGPAPEDEGDDYVADQRADDPRRGQAAEINRDNRRIYG